MTGALVLFSGGKDSTVALAWALDRYDQAVAVSFDVPFRPDQEQRAAALIAHHLGVRHETVPMPFMRDAAQVGSSISAGARQTAGAYVPARNLVYHGTAIHLATVWGLADVVAGHVLSDGSAYTDATAAHLQGIYALAASGHDAYGGFATPRLVLPFIELTDAEVVALGRSLGAPLAASWSCLEDGPTPCGICVSCRDREEALGAA